MLHEFKCIVQAAYGVKSTVIDYLRMTNDVGIGVWRIACMEYFSQEILANTEIYNIFEHQKYIYSNSTKRRWKDFIHKFDYSCFFNPLVCHLNHVERCFHSLNMNTYLPDNFYHIFYSMFLLFEKIFINERSNFSFISQLNHHVSVFVYVYKWSLLRITNPYKCKCRHRDCPITAYSIFIFSWNLGSF